MNYLAGFALFVACINEMQTPCDLPAVWWESGQEKTDGHVHGIPPRYNTGMKLSAKIQLPPSGTWGQVFSTHGLEPDGQCTCLVSVHVSLQARRPNLRLHAGVKKNQPLLLCVCVWVCVHARMHARVLPELEKSVGSLTLVDTENKLRAVLQEGR